MLLRVAMEEIPPLDGFTLALAWDGSGPWVCAKRLEKGRFRWPKVEGRHSVIMRPEELAMLSNGSDEANPAA